MKDSENAIKDCPECGGEGQMEVDYHGHLIVMTCEDCRGTGEAVCLTDPRGELPDAKNTR